LGRPSREAGHSRVPAPPHMIRGMTVDANFVPTADWASAVSQPLQRRTPARANRPKAANNRNFASFNRHAASSTRLPVQMALSFTHEVSASDSLLYKLMVRKPASGHRKFFSQAERRQRQCIRGAVAVVSPSPNPRWFGRSTHFGRNATSTR
jgi:hypothetical protein